MKTDVLFAGLNLYSIVQEKIRQVSARSIDSALKTRGVKDLYVESVVVCPHPQLKFLATRLFVPLCSVT